MTKNKRILRFIAVVLAVVIGVNIYTLPSNAKIASFKAGKLYYITSVSTEKSLKIDVSKMSQITKGTPIKMYKKTKLATEKFSFERIDDGYLIHPYKQMDKVVYPNAKKVGSTIAIRNKKSKYDLRWKIEKVSGGVVFKLMANPTLCLAANKNSLVIETYAKKTKQIFRVEATTKAVELAVPTISQKDERWRDVPLVPGESWTIGNSGCLMTCVVAVMSYVDGKNYRPDRYMKKLTFYSGGYLATGLMPEWKWHDDYDLDEIKKMLDKKKAVIVGGYSYDWGYHYAVVYGYKNAGRIPEDYMVMDPSGLTTNLYGQIGRFNQQKVMSFLK